MTSIGMTPAWRSSVRDKLGIKKTMPKSKAGMIAKLTPAMKDLMSKKVRKIISIKKTFFSCLT